MKSPMGSALVGQWKGTVASGETKMDVAFELRSDGTFTETIQVPKASFAGTYVLDPAKKTLTVTVVSTTDARIIASGTTMTQDISISEDKRTFRASGAGSSGLFTRQ